MLWYFSAWNVFKIFHCYSLVSDFVAILSFNFSKFHFKGDAMLVHDGMMFSTYDNDNDGKIENCALNYHGGWWYHLCHEANLNGKYYPAPGKPISFATGVNWKQFRGFQESLKTSVMALSLKWLKDNLRLVRIVRNKN